MIEERVLIASSMIARGVLNFGDDYIREAVANLKAINPDYIIPAHCTGETFYEIAKAETPGKVG
jgi:metal-dependent hydrolase (beta-lactamase superfamily II)